MSSSFQLRIEIKFLFIWLFFCISRRLSIGVIMKAEAEVIKHGGGGKRSMLSVFFSGEFTAGMGVSGGVAWVTGGMGLGSDLTGGVVWIKRVWHW